MCAPVLPCFFCLFVFLAASRALSVYSYVEAEVVYAAREEHACTAVDVLARRTRLAFVDQRAALAAVPRVVELLRDALQWDDARCHIEREAAQHYLRTTMGVPLTTAATTGTMGADPRAM